MHAQFRHVITEFLDELGRCTTQHYLIALFWLCLAFVYLITRTILWQPWQDYREDLQKLQHWRKTPNPTCHLQLPKLRAKNEHTNFMPDAGIHVASDLSHRYQASDVVFNVGSPNKSSAWQISSHMHFDDLQRWLGAENRVKVVALHIQASSSHVAQSKLQITMEVNFS